MWSNKKYGKKQFKGSYERDSKGERIFILTEQQFSPSTKAQKKIADMLGGEFLVRRISFESASMAKSLGWSKV